MDDTYQIYINRVVRMATPDTYQTRVRNIQASPKFQQGADGNWQANPFPGYTVMTPPWQGDAPNAPNAKLYESLQTLQTSLAQQLPKQTLALLPPQSLHMTLADLIWADAYRHAQTTPDFDTRLHQTIGQSFQQITPAQEPSPWQILGLIVMPRALGVCLAPKDAVAYQQIIELRRAIYQNSALAALGIEQQYHFTAHITLGYFGDLTAATAEYQASNPQTPFLEHLTQVLTAVNHELVGAIAPTEFQVNRAELRKFDDMTHYYRQPDWPCLGW